MDAFTTRKLNLTPRTDAELTHVLSRFEQKWQVKARRMYGDGLSARQ